jgi:hypothetical protein
LEKTIAVADSKNGYFYTGRIDARSYGLSREKIILDMIAGKNLENRTIVMDRGYVTLGLVENLVNLGFHVVKTIKKYANLPNEIRTIQKFKERNFRKKGRRTENQMMWRRR